MLVSPASMAARLLSSIKNGTFANSDTLLLLPSKVLLTANHDQIIFTHYLGLSSSIRGC